jgi:hypothetical protein
VDSDARQARSDTDRLARSRGVKSFFRFRLSTVLWIVALVAVLLAWYVDHNREHRGDVVGVWYYPTPDVSLSGYWETLTISSDGTFTKLEQGRVGSETYSGTYSIAKDGLVTFHVTSKQFNYGKIPPQIEVYDVDAKFRCRVALDPHANLVIANLNAQPPSDSVRIVMPDTLDVDWQTTYSSINHEAQDKAEIEELLNSLPPQAQ